MARFHSDRERRLWIAVAIAVALLLAALYPLQFVLDALRSRNLLRLSISALFLICAVVVGGVLARRGARFATWVVVTLAAALYALFALAMEVPQERLHLVEYGALALLVRAAIVESVATRRLGRRVTSVDVWTLAVVTAIGWLDEGVQGALPNRQYDLRDVAFNAAAAALALGVAGAVRATMKSDGAIGPDGVGGAGGVERVHRKMTSELQTILLQLAVAALGGLAVGIEREWSGRHPGEPARFGGVRTFLLLGLIGGLAAVLFRTVDPKVGILMFAAGLGLVLIAYLASAWKGTIDATSEVAGLVVLGAGAAAGFGMLTLSSAIAAGTALVLVEKGRMHAAVARLESSGLEAGARFAVLALVVLPILPAGPIERLGGLEPQKLWGIVLIFAGLSFAGYIALRLVGPERGYSVAGFLGGLVSSTAVTFNFARESRRAPDDPEVSKALALGVVAACTILPLRVGAVCLALNAEVARAVAPALVLPVVAAAVALAFAWLRKPEGKDGDGSPRLPDNPLRLGAAIQMALLFQVVLWALSALRGRVGSAGLVASSALLGLTDMDALTFWLTELAGRGAAEAEAAAGVGGVAGVAGLTAAEAARGLIIGMLANTIFKATVAVVLGAAAFRWRVVVALAFLGALVAVGLLWI